MIKRYTQTRSRGGSFARVLLLATLAVSLARSSSKVAPDAESATSSTRNVIVQFRHAPSTADHRKVQARGGALWQEWPAIHAAAYSMPAEAVSSLADDPDIAYISPDREVKGSLDYSDETINATIALQAGMSGKGIGVAVLDSGVTTVSDLDGVGKKAGSRVAYSENFAAGAADVFDQYGHGTHVTGIIAGNGYDSTGARYTYTFRGVAPNVQIINLRVLNKDGKGTDSSVIAAIYRAISLRSKYNIRVLNLSLGRRVFESYRQDPLCQAVEAAWKAGIVVVVAAGNNGRDDSLHTSGYGMVNAPGNDPYVITVGAMKTMETPSRSDDLIASYSSKGPTLIDHIVKPDLVAPGNRVISLRPPQGFLSDGYPQDRIPYSVYTRSGDNRISQDYFELSGTSMAAAMVSGASALLLEQQPWLTPDQVKARLMKTASKTFPAMSLATDPATGAIYQSEYDIFTIGAGYLDVWAAIQSQDANSGSAKSPTAVFDPAAGTVSVQFDSAGIWGTSPSWSSSVVWGDSVFRNLSSVVWGDSLVWGDTTSAGFSVIWGTSVVWGDALTNTPENVSSVNVLVYGEQ